MTRQSNSTLNAGTPISDPVQNRIHAFFIFTRAGTCTYWKNFTEKYQIKENLISSFFSALMSFSTEVMGKKIKTIEMGDVKFVIINIKSYFYGFLCHPIENMIFLETLTDRLHKKFTYYIATHNINTDYEQIEEARFAPVIAELFDHRLSTYAEVQKETEIYAYLNDLLKNDEIEGIILLTDRGKIVFNSFNRIKLKALLKEVEFRVKICNNSILKMFYTSKEGELIFSEYVGDSYFIILVFDLTVKYGIAEFHLRKTVNSINQLLELS
ncbi:MAG: hypothetical protein ACOC44_14810 [Promethearchaeia archaeon]